MIRFYLLKISPAQTLSMTFSQYVVFELLSINVVGPIPTIYASELFVRRVSGPQPFNLRIKGDETGHEEVRKTPLHTSVRR